MSEPGSHQEVFHITTPHEWAQALEMAVVAPRSLEAEGFIHCSTASQLDATIARHFAGASELVLLRLRRDLLEPELRWEPGGNGALYPHLYRPLRVAEVDDAIPWPISREA